VVKAGKINLDGFGNVRLYDGSGILCKWTGRETDAEVRELFGKLVRSKASRGVLVTIDKTALNSSSKNHEILILEDITVTPTVTVDGSIETNTFTATFSGEIRLGGLLSCKIQTGTPEEPGDEITFDVEEIV